MICSYLLYEKFYCAFLLIPFFFLSVFIVDGQVTSEVNFSNFDHIKNFPNQEVFSVVRDKNGFLWIGFTDGLYRFDASYNMKVYKVDEPKIKGGIQSNFIRVLYEDSNDNLWIGTTLGGLTKFHQPSGTWTTYRTNEADPYSISSNEILSILEDSKGRIWIGTENGLNLLDVAQERFIRFMPDFDNPDALSAKAVISILEIRERKKIEQELYERDKYLEHLVSKRTSQLSHKNVEVNALLHKLKKRNDELEDIVAARTKKISDFNEELKRSNNDLEQFAYIASHDLQAPLRTIQSFSGLLGKNMADKMTDRDKDFLGFINSSIGNMQELIDALLAFSKVNSQARKIQPVNPNKLIHTIQAELGAVLEEQNAVVQLSV